MKALFETPKYQLRDELPPPGRISAGLAIRWRQTSADETKEFLGSKNNDIRGAVG
ncbi:MAG: hypothetical protein HY335_02285 [Deinococcus sp.]|nr:hypothetical protein [Deinococcus sp.]